MKGLIQKLWRGQDGVAMLVVLGFMALAIPMVTGILSLTSTVTKDSQVKTSILKNQYSAQGCTQHAAYRLNNESGYADSFLITSQQSYNFDGCNITITLLSYSQASEVAYADLVLVLDNSLSIDYLELEDLKQAANEIVDAFSLSTTDSRVAIGVARFAGTSEVLQGMTDVDEHGTSVPLHDAINGLPLISWPGLAFGTNIVAGLNAGASTYTNGQGDRVDPPYPVPNLMVYITDGDDNSGNSDTDIANASAATGAEVFAIGVGDDVEMDTINAIATDPDADHAFTTSDFNGLLAIIDDIVNAVYGSAALGSLFYIETVGPNGTINVSEVLIPPA